MNGQDQKIQLSPENTPHFLQFLVQALRQGTLEPDPPGAPQPQPFQGSPPIRPEPPADQNIAPDMQKKYPGVSPEMLQYLRSHKAI